MLISGLVFAVYLTVKAFSLNEWNTIAATLAVITAIISIFMSQQIVWKQEDEYEPEIVIQFDLDSRSNVVQFVMKNTGGSNAYDIKIRWLTSLTDFKTIEILLPYIPVLGKNESLRHFVGISTEIFQKAETEHKKLIFKGIITYKNKINNKKYVEKNFEISLEPFRRKVRPITDEQEYYLKNVNISKHIERIANSVEQIEKRTDGKGR